MYILLHDPSVCLFMYGQVTESRWVNLSYTVVSVLRFLYNSLSPSKRVRVNRLGVVSYITIVKHILFPGEYNYCTVSVDPSSTIKLNVYIQNMKQKRNLY